MYCSQEPLPTLYPSVIFGGLERDRKDSTLVYIILQDTKEIGYRPDASSAQAYEIERKPGVFRVSVSLAGFKPPVFRVLVSFAGFKPRVFRVSISFAGFCLR